MTRKQFIKGFEAKRFASYRAEVKAGTMRDSEAAMGLACVHADAIQLWRKHRADYLRMKPEDLFK
jgi:hypothetical protein